MICQNILLYNNFNLNWFINNYSIILGYFFFYAIEKYIPRLKSDNINKIFLDNFKVTLGFLTQFFITTKYNLSNNLHEILGYIVYHMFTKKILI
jgi:hypothetical protein